MHRRTHRLSFLAASCVAAAIGLSHPQALFAQGNDICHPEIDLRAVHYVVGYGSLMNTVSKEITWPDSSISLPVSVDGYRRAWNTLGTPVGFSTTFLGTTPQEGANMVAALFRVSDPGQFGAGDEREFPYCREEIDPSQVSMLDGSSTPMDGHIWIYIVKPDHIHSPDSDFPIIQSYVDIFLNGCIELEAQVIDEAIDFAGACIATTADWSSHWVNDRLYPRRPFDIPNALRIDELLQRELPEEFAAIRIE